MFLTIWSLFVLGFNVSLTLFQSYCDGPFDLVEALWHMQCLKALAAFWGSCCRLIVFYGDNHFGDWQLWAQLIYDPAVMDGGGRPGSKWLSNRLAISSDFSRISSPSNEIMGHYITELWTIPNFECGEFLPIKHYRPLSEGSYIRALWSGSELFENIKWVLYGGLSIWKSYRKYFLDFWIFISSQNNILVRDVGFSDCQS